MKFPIGQTVKLKRGLGHKCPKDRENNKIARVSALINGGIRMMDKPLQGCKFWNIEQLEIAKDK